MENTKQRDFMQEYFGVLVKGETYLNFAYLLLAFPLGLIYFILLVVGFSTGLSLIIIWVGLLILAVLFPAIWAGAAFERLQAIHLLKVDVPPMSKPITEEKSLLERMKVFFTNPVTWKGLLYLFLKFPIGILEFVIVVTGLSIVFSFLAAPFAYPWISIDFGMWMIDSFSEAIGVFIVGVLLLPGIFHVFNYTAKLNGMLAKVMLGQNDFVQSQPVPQETALPVLPTKEEQNIVEAEEPQNTTEQTSETPTEGEA